LCCPILESLKKLLGVTGLNLFDPVELKRPRVSMVFLKSSRILLAKVAE